MLLCGYYGFGNLGDELLAKALIDLLLETGLEREELALLSSAPEDSRRSLGIDAFDRWSFREVAGALRRSRTLLLGGGGLFQDITSLRSPLYYWGVVHMAEFFRCRPWCFGQSVGPLRSAWGRSLARSALRRCNPCVARDLPSASLLQEWGITASLSADPVLALRRHRSALRGEAVLVNLRPWHGGLPERSAAAARRLASGLGLPLVGLALAPEDEVLMEKLRDEGRLPLARLRRLRGWDDVDVGFAEGHLAFGMRLHFNMLSLLAGVPSVAVPYDPKVRAFAEAWRIPLWEGEETIPLETFRREEEADAESLRRVRAAIRSDLAAAWRQMEEGSRR